MATDDNTLSGDDIAQLFREYGLPSTEWGTPGKTSEVAPIIGGTWQQHYPRPRGLKKLALMRTKAGLVSAPAHVSDNTNADAIYGTSALRFAGTAAYEFRSSLGGTAGVMPAVDITAGSVRVWIRGGPNFFDPAALAAFRLRLYSAGSPSAPSANYTEFDLGFMRGQIIARTATDWGFWQSFTVPGFNATIASDSLAGVTRGGTGATATAITYASLFMQGTGVGIQIEVGDIEFVPNPRTKGAVIFTFDDGRLDQFTGAAEIMSRYGFPGVLFSGAPAVEIGAANRLSVQQVKTLQDVHGWQIASGCWSHEDLTAFRALDGVGRTAWFAKLRAWHAALGLRGGMDFAYQTGISQSEPDIFAPIRQHFRTARTYGGPAPAGQPVLHFGEAAPLSDPMRYRCVEFEAGRFNVANGYADQIKPFIDQAANNKAAAIFVTHNAFETAKTQNLQNLRDMCADVSSRSDVEWITLDEYVRSYS